MPLVLAIEPDLRQAAIVKRVVREKVQADVAVVDSRDAALEAIRARVPDVLLLSALLSPRDEDELISHLRTLNNADHLQTHTIPLLASSLQRNEDGAAQGLLSRFRRKKETAVVSGCDPDAFAEEVRVFLERAEEKKRERELSGREHHVIAAPVAGLTAAAAADPSDPAASGSSSSSSWDSPFEWPATNREGSAPQPASAEPGPELVLNAELQIAASESAHPAWSASMTTAVEEPPQANAAADQPAVLEAPTNAIRHSEFVFGNPVSSLSEPALVEPSLVEAVLVEPASTAEEHLEAPPEAAVFEFPEPLPVVDPVAPFIAAETSRGLRRDAARWIRTIAPRSTGSSLALPLRLTTREPASETFDMRDAMRVRIRAIRVRSAA
ncbi:MAG TPA: hypothetical protein VGL62_00825 [Vicinamibacterales bacterium]